MRSPPSGTTHAARKPAPLRTAMRLPLLSRAEQTPEQQKLYADMRSDVENDFKGVHVMDDDGALIGPWNPWLHFPKFGGPVRELSKAFTSSPALPGAVRQVAILVTGARFHAAYELYAHAILGEAGGIPEDKIATIVAGQRPTDLSREEALAYDVTSALVSGGVLPDPVYRRALATFGEDGTAELISL